MENKREARKGDLVERLQGKEVIDFGLVTEVVEKYHRPTGYLKVYWQTLQRYQTVHKRHIRVATKKVN